jgi:hypothetical protein
LDYLNKRIIFEPALKITIKVAVKMFLTKKKVHIHVKFKEQLAAGENQRRNYLVQDRYIIEGDAK